MTCRSHSVCLAVITILLAGSSAAHAGDIWDYLEALSGPGPFRGPGSITVSGLCLAAVAPHENGQEPLRSHWSLAGIPPSAEKTPEKPCLFFDANPRLSANMDARFAEVKLRMLDFGVTFPVLRALEVGVGVGQMRFDSKGISTTRTSVTFPRLVIKPLLFIPPLRNNKKKWPGFLKYYVSTVTLPGLSGTNFGVSNDVYDNRNRHEFLTSAGVTFDLLELVERY